MDHEFIDRYIMRRDCIVFVHSQIQMFDSDHFSHLEPHVYERLQSILMTVIHVFSPVRLLVRSIPSAIIRLMSIIHSDHKDVLLVHCPTSSVKLT